MVLEQPPLSVAVAPVVALTAAPPPVDNGPPPPPELELGANFEAPIVAGTTIWSVNPSSDRLALIDAKTRQVRVVETGRRPTYITHVPTPSGASPRALVLNVGEASLSLFEAGTEIRSDDFPVTPQANSWAVSKEGRFAAAYTDSSQIELPALTEGYQDLSLVDMRAKTPLVIDLVAGYRPRKVLFNQDETRLIVVGQNDITTFDLSGDTPKIERSTEIPSQSTVPPQIEIDPTGLYALVLQQPSKTLSLVNLASGESKSITLASYLTDVDFDSTGSFAVGVMPNINTFTQIPIPNGFDDINTLGYLSLGLHNYGSIAISESGSQFVTYTTATQTPYIDVISGSPLARRELDLKAPLRTVQLNQSGAFGVGLLLPASNADSTGAFALIPVVDPLPVRLKSTIAPPTSLAISSGENQFSAMVICKDENTSNYAAYLAEMPTFRVDEYVLQYEPVAAGFIESEDLAFIAEKHPLGKIDFINITTKKLESITGFEVAAGVVR